MPDKKTLRILLANPRGFCAGVDRAIEIVERALEKEGAPVYVRHEIVHNRFVVESLRKKGAVFVNELDEVPDGALTIFSAHGVSDAVQDEAAGRDLPVINATCPLVTKVHNEGRNHAKSGREVILIGHKGHPEVEGTMGSIDGTVHLVASEGDVENLNVGDPKKLAYVTQTTLSVDDTRDVIAALKRRFPAILGPDIKDICYATQNRQQAVRKLSERIDLLIVIGAGNSSNSNRLREIGAEAGLPSHLINDASELDPAWLDDIKTVGITAGASAPEILIKDLIERIGSLVSAEIEETEGVEETISFRLPRELSEESA